MRLFSLSFLILVLGVTTSFGQTPISAPRAPAPPFDSNRSKARVDTTLPNTPVKTNGLWHRPQVQREGASLYFTSEAMRFYASPTNFSQLLDESGGAYPLLLGEESYGRESFVVTSRTSEGLVSTLMDGIMPMSSILNGTTLTNYFPISAFSDISLNSGAGGLAITGADYAASDVGNFSVERFRAPLPYSRIKYTQDLGRSNSVFDGMFSINATPSTNLAFGIYRRATGSVPNVYDPTFNPRSDMWSGRVQMSVSKFLGTLPHDSTMTQHKIDSILTLPATKQRTLDLLVWGQYVTGFSGLNGGIQPHTSDSDIFDPQVAQVLDINTFDHRVRMDALVDLELPLLAEARTRVGAYASYESRRILSRDTTFPFYIPDVAVGRRLGVTLSQPLTLTIGDFLTRAVAEGSAQRIDRDRVFTYGSPMSDTRLSASFSDSLALRTAFRISLFGYVRTTQSSLKIGTDPVAANVFPSIGLYGTIGFTDAISFTASYNYAKDRAALSPSPEQTYLLRNIGGFFDLRFPLSRRDSIAIHAGVLLRNEPEGVVYDYTAPQLPLPTFSNAPIDSKSILLNLDAYFSQFHFSSSLTYLPTAIPATNAPLTGNLLQRFYGFAGFYYENEIGEGNLRFSLGIRSRLINRLEPQLTYDRAIDYYLFEGPIMRVDSKNTATVEPLNDARVTTPKATLDVLLAMEVDRRAQVNMSFLNILSTPFYNTSFYPRPGFHWKIDVTWAFLD